MIKTKFNRDVETLLLALTLFAIGVASPSEAEIDMPKALDDRLAVELFAAEPDVVTITGLTVDRRGRILAVESHTHFRPENYDGPPTDRIRLLEDTDHDGKADRTETFFSGTISTMNIAAHPNGWVYVATRNSILRIRDTDDDGKSDERQMLVRLETAADYPHNGLSGFAFDFSGSVYFGMGENEGRDGTLVGGPGEIYFTLGQNYGEDATLVSTHGTRLAASRGSGGVFRCREDGSELERVATGFWNPFHLCFDAFGRLFVGDNDPGNRPPCRFLTIVDGGDYGYRRRTLEPFIAVDGEVPGTLPMTSSTGESPTGLHVYESDHLPADYRGSVLVASWGEHRIDRYRLSRDGASFKATTQAVIAGGEFFRPAGIAVAPDGSLYVGDWADRSYPLHGKGRVWHITCASKHDAPSETHEKSGDADDPGHLSASAPTDLAAIRIALRSLDRWNRETAARRLLAEGDVGIAILRDALQDDQNPRVRSLALAALINVDALTKELADRAIADPCEAVREQAARTLPKQLIDLVHVARSDGAPAVQAAAFRRIADSVAEPACLERLDDPDPFMRQAARRGLGRSVSFRRLIELTGHEQAGVRLAAVLLLRGGPNTVRQAVAAVKSVTSVERPARDLHLSDFDAVIAKALQDPDPRVRFAVVEWIGRDELQQFQRPLVDGLAAGATTPRLFTAYLAALAQLDGVMQHWTKGTVDDWWAAKATSHRYASRLLDDPQSSPDVLRQVLLFLPPNHPALTVQRLHKLIESDNLDLQAEAVRTLRGLPSQAAKKLIVAVAQDQSLSEDIRAEALMGLVPENTADREMLVQLAVDGERAIRDEALRTLRGAALDDEQRQKLSGLSTIDNATAELVAKVVSPQQKALHPDVADGQAWRKLLDGPANGRAGQRVFFHPKGPGCFRCHRIDGRGQAIGPSFVRGGERLALTRQRLIEAILQPSKDVDPGYLPLTIVTTDGQIATGIYHKHGNNIRSIIDSEGKIQSFKVDDIETMVPQNQSIMPDGLVDAMTIQELRDLVAFLAEK